jgi:hypothetical protein
MYSRMKSAPASVVGYVVLIVILTAGAAQSLSGTNTVFSDDIVDGTIATPDLKTGAVSGTKILDNSVTAADIAAGAVDSSEVADGSIGTFDIANGGITSEDIGVDQIGENQIGDNSIGTTEIDDEAVTSADVDNDSIGTADIATGGVGGAEVANRALTLDDFAIAEDANVVTTTSINANTCVTINTGLTGAVVGDLPIVVLRSATGGTFWEGLRVTTAGQFPLRACNTTDGNLPSATSTIDVFTVRP